MKIESMFCGRCNGNGAIRIMWDNKVPEKDRIKDKDCPNCDGTGVLVAISLKNYRQMKHLIHTQNRELERVE